MADVRRLDDHRECEALFDVRVYRHPNGSIVANAIWAADAWFAETPDQTHYDRMRAAADLLPQAASCMRQHADELEQEDRSKQTPQDQP